MSTRNHARIAPTFWTGATGKALRRRGSDALLVAMYLLTSPHSNMLGLYPIPIPYMGYETGLGEEGVAKALRACIEVGFCTYDQETEMVWIHEMAAWQVADELKATDLQCKGIQKLYDALPASVLLARFFERYATAFHMVQRRDDGTPLQQSLLGPSEAPSKQGIGEGVGEGEERDYRPAASSVGKKPTPSVPCPYQAIVEAYHTELPTLPKVRLMPKSRQETMRKVWAFVLTSKKSDGSPRATTADEAIEWLRGYFRRASENDFLMGRTTRAAEHKNWRCDLDYLLTDRGMAQVIEKTSAGVAA